MGLFDTVGSMWEGMPLWDKAALMTAPVPVLGDIVGFGADVKNFYDEPSWLNAGLGLAGLLPWVPSGGITKAAINASLQKAATNLRNDIPGFYSGKGGMLGQGASFLKTIPEGATNIVKSRYGPKSRAIQKKWNISAADQTASKDAIKISEEITTKVRPLEAKIQQMKKNGTAYTGEYRTVTHGAKKGKRVPVETEEFKNISSEAVRLRSIANTAGKKAMGQINQTRSMLNQYHGPKSKQRGFIKHIDEIDHIKTFNNFSVDDYFKTVGDLVPSGTGREGIEEIFKKIETLPSIGMNPKKNYQMNIRRVHTGSAGELDPGISAKVYGGGTLSLENIKEGVFANKKGYNSDKEFLEQLINNGVNVLNPDAVLKGRPAVITGAGKSDAWELGGVNYMTSINKRGKVTTIINDEHDLLSSQKLNKLIKTDAVGKLPGADRYMNVSEPIVYDLVKPKKLTAIQSKAKKKLSKQKKIAEQNAIENYKKVPGVDMPDNLPAGFKTKEQYLRAKAVANLDAGRDWTRIAVDQGLFGLTGLRGGTPFVREKFRDKEEEFSPW